MADHETRETQMASAGALRWQEMHDDNFYGFDERGLLAASVVPYRTGGRRWWAVFMAQERMPGEFATPREAKAAADDADPA
jgi:hypothetical protein